MWIIGEGLGIATICSTSLVAHPPMTCILEQWIQNRWILADFTGAK